MTFRKNCLSNKEIEKLKKEGKYIIYKEPGYLASKYKKGGPYYKKKTTKIKVNNIYIEEISSFSEDSNSGKN